MMKQFKWFWPWQDEQEEDWLTKQSLKDMSLTSVQFPHKYIFDHSSTQRNMYQLDYFDPKKEDLREYMDERNRQGWFFIGSMHGWHYFSRPSNAAAQIDTFQHAGHKKEKFYHMLNFLVGFFPIIVIWFPVFGGDFPKPLYYYLAGAAGGIFVGYIWYSIKVYQRANQLRKIVSSKQV